jgi:hypothetical protein
MKDKEYFESVVKDLTELEMEDLLQVCKDYLIKNRCIAMGENLFKEDGLLTMDDLEDEISELKKENENLEEKIDRYETIVSEAISKLQDI